MDNPRWKGILPTPTTFQSHQLVKRTKPTSFSRAHTFENSKTTTVNVHSRTGHKPYVTSVGPLTTYSAWLNNKNLTFGFYHRKKSNQVQFSKPHPTAKGHNKSKNHKHPRLGLKVDTQPVPITHVHAFS